MVAAASRRDCDLSRAVLAILAILTFLAIPRGASLFFGRQHLPNVPLFDFERGEARWFFRSCRARRATAQQLPGPSARENYELELILHGSSIHVLTLSVETT